MSDINKFAQDCKILKYKIKKIERLHRRYLLFIDDVITGINSDYQTQQRFGEISNRLQNILDASIQNQSVEHNYIVNIHKSLCKNIKMGGAKKNRCISKTKKGKRCGTNKRH